MLSADDRVWSPPAPVTSRDRRPGPVVCLLAALASGVLLLFGTGLQPVWWLAWLAPVPVLAVAPRVRARRAAWVAVLAGLVGMAGYAWYLSADLEAPPVVPVSYAAVATAVVVATVLLYRALAVRGLVLVAALAAPATWASGEYLVATLTTAGTNWALADSQADDLPVLQVVSLVGPWGVGFVMLAVAAAVAGMTIPGVPARRRVEVALLGIAVLVAALTWGVVALSAAPAPAAPLTVSTVAAARGPNQPSAASPAGRALVEADLAWLAGAPDGGLVVFPEKDLRVDDADLPPLTARFAGAARARASTVVLGVEHRSGDTIRNEALVFTPRGEQPQVYVKRYPVPGVEDELTAGDRMAMVPGSDPRVGVAICADLGQASLGREYGGAGTGVLAVPALDFDVDGWSQSRVQFLRGVENGYTVARASRQGLLTVSDPNGRVLAETPVDGRHTNAVSVPVANAPGGTLYTWWGDWFAWLCLAATAGALALALTRRGAASTISRAEGR